MITCENALLCAAVLLYVRTFYSLFFCFCWCIVADLVCMELTACQTCLKRNLSPWSAMWSVLTCQSFPMYIYCMSYVILFVLFFLCECSFFLFVRPPQKSQFFYFWAGFGMRLLPTNGDKQIWNQIWNQPANFSLPPLLNPKTIPHNSLERIHSPWSGYGKSVEPSYHSPFY